MLDEDLRPGDRGQADENTNTFPPLKPVILPACLIRGGAQLQNTTRGLEALHLPVSTGNSLTPTLLFPEDGLPYKSAAQTLLIPGTSSSNHSTSSRTHLLFWLRAHRYFLLLLTQMIFIIAR